MSQRDGSKGTDRLSVVALTPEEAERRMADAAVDAFGDHPDCPKDADGHYTGHVNCEYAHMTARQALGETMEEHRARRGLE